jgi:hypothetical protein
MNPNIQADFESELAEIAAESMGWQQLDAGVYLHAGDDDATEVLITGQATAAMAGLVVVWLV